MKRGYLWTREEEEPPQQLFLQHPLPAEIAKELGRTVSSVKSKAHALGLTIARFGNRRLPGLSRWDEMQRGDEHEDRGRTSRPVICNDGVRSKRSTERG